MSIQVQPRVNDDDVVILGVDPGEHHVGVAVGCRYFAYREHGEGAPCWDLETPGWRVYETEEMTPDQFVDWVHPYLIQSRIDIVTCEKFTLYPDKAREQTGSEMMTSQLIGWLRHTIRMLNSDPAQELLGSIQWESNPASIQKPTAAVLKRLGIKPVSKASPGHDRSAELHLWHTLIRNNLVDGVSGDRGDRW